MAKFIITDWAGNVLFGKCFNSEDDALLHIDTNINENERDDIFITPKEGEIKNNKFYAY